MRLVEELSEALKQALADNTSLKTKVHELRIENARIIRDGVLKESGLSQDTIKKLHLIFAKSTDNAGLRQAIHVEQRQRGTK